MRFKFGCLYIAFLITITNYCYAQKGTSIIKGTVNTGEGLPADAASAVLIHLSDSIVVMSALVDKRGAFQFTNIPKGKYTVLATMLGYKRAYSSAFEVPANKLVNLSPIVLAATSAQLKEIAVTGKRRYIEVKPDKTIINPGASIIAAGQSVLDVLKQSPGVRVDNNDNVSISGRQDALIMIDGKATNLNGPELAALLKGTPGSNIDRIELLRSGSARYDASAGGVVNIVYKKGKNLGTNGTYNASAGYGRYYKASSGISFNTRTKNYNVFGAYSVNGNKTYRDIDNDRLINYQGIQSEYNSLYHNTSNAVAHNFRLGTDFFLSPSQTLGFLVSGLASNTDYNKNNNLMISNSGKLDSIINATSGITRNINNINYNINYTGKLDTSGRTISANVTHTRSNRRSDEYITNEFFTNTYTPYRDPLLLQNLSPTHITNWTAMVDYSNPLRGGAKLDAGLKFSRTNTDNNLVFGPKVNGVYTVDDDLSNHFLFTEHIAAAYLNYTGKWGKYSLDAGLRGEYTNNKGTSVTTGEVTPHKYFNLFPTLILNYHENEKNDYSLTLNRGISRPAYDKLNPFLYFVDLYNYQAGNPYLQPQYSNRLSLGYTYNQQWVTSVYAIVNTGAAFPYYSQDDESKINLSTEVNLGRAYNYGVTLNAPVTVAAWWTSIYDIDASYQRYVAYPQYGNLNKATGDLIINTTQDFQLSKTIAAQLTAKYESATFYGINQFRPTFIANAGLSKSLFSNMGKLSIGLTDIFKTYRDRSFTNYQNLNLRIVDVREYRKVTVSFSYRFGRSTVKGAAKHSIGNEDVQSRMSIK